MSGEVSSVGASIIVGNRPVKWDGQEAGQRIYSQIVAQLSISIDTHMMVDLDQQINDQPSGYQAAVMMHDGFSVQ